MNTNNFQGTNLLRNELEKVLNEAGFELIKIEDGYQNELSNANGPEIIIQATKKLKINSSILCFVRLP